MNQKLKSNGISSEFAAWKEPLGRAFGQYTQTIKAQIDNSYILTHKALFSKKGFVQLGS